MRTSTRVLIVCHERDTALADHYTLHGLATRWRQRGFDVRVQCGWRERPPADLVIPHIDVTQIPAAAQAMLAHYPRVLNRALVDISKRRISGNLLAPGDDWRGPVIIKTDANHAGVPDETRKRRRRPLWHRLRRIPAPPLVLPPPPGQRYRVLAGLSQVTPDIWSDPGLVVEKFLPERDGDHYVVRQWWLLGSRVVERRQVATTPIAVSQSVVARENAMIDPPPELIALRSRFGIDYGKIDFVRHQGRVEVFDIATTPTGRSMLAREREMVHLAEGIDAFLNGAS